MLAEAAFIGLDQAHLADRGGGLQFVYRSGTLVPAEALHAFGDRAGGYQHDLMAAGAERGDLARPVAERGQVQPGALVRHQAAADLDDDALAVAQYGFHVCLNGVRVRFLRAFGCGLLLQFLHLQQMLHDRIVSSLQPSPLIAEITK